ncbi:hypothetical protein P154DRAFT_313306 [Amniculicola lignicola CBS 123094]|uniref:Uncharacterized protein n=1 Tax=Amniculicola lignicola CBS 123094 TaxID=1392246 RepID=A0A6A5WXU6_9PLEO|nr:hypothetical protein P154DRAFT_313306 [Amniculicola lignicola CBS 123094]
MRALRIRDENALPQVPAGKALHQRNKSTPALSTLVQAGGLRGAATKRTAFADVSNTSRQPLAKDDLQLPGKASKLDVLKDPAVLAVKEKSAALLRPAQRPLASASTNTANALPNVASSTTTKHVASDAGVSIATNARKVVPKKSTAVFREDPGVEAASVIARQPVTARAEASQNVERTAVLAKPTTTTFEHDPTTLLLTLERHIERETQQAVVATETQPHTYVKEHPLNAKFEVQEEKYEYLDALEEQARVLEQERNDELAQTQGPNGLDAEEYWDEDEEEEYFEADGYTTVRSLRSRGDNTTGGVTAILAPRVTAKVQRELDAARAFVEANKSPEDVEDEQWDTSMVAEYGDEIFEYFHSLEERMKPNETYMDHQAEIQWSMRSVLMDWLVQVHGRFTLLPETLFLAVNYVDRFLSCKVVSLGKLQLVGATALFVAAKYEEINCPSVQEIVFMVDGAYTVDEILKAERFMLSMLQFELGWPGPMSFLRRISKADDYDLETRTLAKYFLEITVMDERFVGCSPSFLSAGAHCLARLMLKKGDWSQAHVHYAGYTMSQLRPLVQLLVECCDNPQKHHSAVYDKYTDKRYKRASVFVENELIKGFQLPFVSRDSLAGQNQTWRRK